MVLAQRRARLDAELVEQRAPRVVERRERVGLAARPVERRHQLHAQPLAQRVERHRGLELGHSAPLRPRARSASIRSSSAAIRSSSSRAISGSANAS